MTDLDIQLADRVRSFLQRTELTQRDVSRAIDCDPGNFSAFLADAKTLSTAKTARLWQLMRLSKSELVEKFSAPKSRITHFQSFGQEIRLDKPANVGWYPGADGSGAGTDPVDSSGITSTRSTGGEGDDPDYDDLTRVLSQVQGLHQAALDAINDYQARQRRARPNAQGSTSAPRQISRPKTPGPRGDLIP